MRNVLVCLFLFSKSAYFFRHIVYIVFEEIRAVLLRQSSMFTFTLFPKKGDRGTVRSTFIFLYVKKTQCIFRETWGTSPPPPTHSSFMIFFYVSVPYVINVFIPIVFKQVSLNLNTLGCNRKSHKNYMYLIQFNNGQYH